MFCVLYLSVDCSSDPTRILLPLSLPLFVFLSNPWSWYTRIAADRRIIQGTADSGHDLARPLSLSLFRSLTRSLTHFQFFSFRSDFAPCISTLTVSGCFGPRNRAGPGRQTQFARPLLRERINWAAVDERNALHRGGDLARSPSCPIGRLISGRARVWWLVGGEFVKQCALISARLYIYTQVSDIFEGGLVGWDRVSIRVWTGVGNNRIERRSQFVSVVANRINAYVIEKRVDR